MTQTSSSVQKITKVVTRKFKKADASLAAEKLDPLHNFTSFDVEAARNQARTGAYARLQFAFAEIERCDPTLLVCVNRRSAAVSELDWKVVRSDERLHIKADEGLAEEQISYLETAMARIRNLPESVEHLALASFRGYSHLFPRRTYDGEIAAFDLPDTWNFAYDRKADKWLWNPRADRMGDPSVGNPEMFPIDACDRVTITEKRPIDWPALIIYLRAKVGEDNWGRFLEQYGIPPVILTMPDGTSAEDADKFVDAARDIFLGSSGAVPYGTSVSYSSESRGTNPFAEFIAHQQKLVVLMATGGLLTSLAESGSGTLAGDAHTDTWKQIGRRESRIIANAINRQVCNRLLDKHFPGLPHLAEFAFDTEATPSPKEVLEIAGLAKNAGLAVDPAEISQRTGYTLTAAPEPMTMGGGFGAMNEEEQNPPVEVSADVVTNEEADEQADASKGGISRLADALRTDFAEVAKRIDAILALPEGERAVAAKKLAEELDGLVPDDPQMAAVIEDEMTKAFDKVVNG